MFLDGAGWHQARELQVAPTIRLLPLPPYSPELNPVEGIWNHLRENHFANRALASLEEVESLLCHALRHLILHPDLVRSMTNYPRLNPLCLTAHYYCASLREKWDVSLFSQGCQAGIWLNYRSQGRNGLVRMATQSGMSKGTTPGRPSWVRVWMATCFDP